MVLKKMVSKQVNYLFKYIENIFFSFVCKLVWLMKKDNKKNLKKKLRLSKGMLLLQELPEIIAEEIAGTF